MRRVRSFEVTDVHVGGEVHRIILNGIAAVPGDSLRAQASFLEREADGLRRLLLYEPRGGLPSLSADLVVEPRHPDAQAGIIIMEFMGYPPYSGSNIMASTIALMESGGLAIREGEQTVTIEVPGGLANVVVECRDGSVVNTTYAPSSAAYVTERNQRIEVEGFGSVEFDMVWSGVFYPVTDASAHGFTLTKNEELGLQAFGHAFVEAARPHVRPVHPDLGDMGPLSFVLFAGPTTKADDQVWERRVAAYVHPSSVCRCPSGTGTTAAIAQLAADGHMHKGDRLRATSWFGTSFVGTILESATVDGRPNLQVATSCPGWVIARTEIVVDLDDPMTPGPGLDVLLPAH